MLTVILRNFVNENLRIIYFNMKSFNFNKVILSLIILCAFVCCPVSATETETEGEATPRPESQKKTDPDIKHPKIGTEAQSADGKIKLTLVNKRQNYGGGSETHCGAIQSPKSVHIAPDGSKYYVNSLEGGKTVVFDAKTNQMIKVISHNLGAKHDGLWAEPREDLYPFTHYPKNNHFMGKPVESTFSHGGRYLWVPYYRRTYDINAQDPSACAVIDTKTDSIIRLFETGPLPKMIATSPDGHYIAISHWGNNTVGLIDISSDDPKEWRHEKLFVVDYVLPLNYSLTTSVDRDNGSGYALRGTVFTPDSKYLLVGCMGGSGGIAVIDVETGKYLGRVLGMMSNVRHLLIHDGYLYLSVNGAGYVQRCKLSDFMDAALSIGNRKTAQFAGWSNAKVGAGARTIEISPSGRYVFAACNNVSQLCVVDTRTMKQVCAIDVDSYPVGLDISDDGRTVYTTSQGRRNGGGNAVDIYEVTYAEEEPDDLSFTAPAFSDNNKIEEVPANDDISELQGVQDNPAAESCSGKSAFIIAGAASLLAIAGAGIFISRRHHA